MAELCDELTVTSPPAGSAQGAHKHDKQCFAPLLSRVPHVVPSLVCCGVSEACIEGLHAPLIGLPPALLIKLVPQYSLVPRFSRAQLLQSVI